MNETGALARLADIEMPAPSAAAAGWWWLAAALTLLAIILFIAWHYRRRRAASPRTLALARLGVLEQTWLHQHTDDRNAAYHAATALRLGLEMNQLHADAPPPGADAHEWRETLALLARTRYTTDSSALNADLFARLRGWLSAAPQER